MSIVLARSGFEASLWLGLPAAIIAAVGGVMAVAGALKVARNFRDYRREEATLAQFHRRVGRAAAWRFTGLQLVAIGLLLGLAAVVALMLPGMAVQAAFVTVFLTAAIWAGQSLVMAGQSVGAAVERLVAGAFQIKLGQGLDFWRWPDRGWALADRVAHARQAGVSDPMARSYLDALDSDGVALPEMVQVGPSVVVDAQGRFFSVLPVLVMALPFAAIAWAAAAWLPDNWVPRLPSPATFLGLKDPPAPMDDAAPLPELDQDSPAEEEGDGKGPDAGDEGAGNSGAGTEDQAGEGGNSGGDEGASGPSDAGGQEGGQEDGPQGDSGGDQSGAGDQGPSGSEGGGAGPDAGPDGNGAPKGEGPGAGDASPDQPAPADGAWQAESGSGEQGEGGTTPPDAGAGQAGDDGGEASAPSAQDQKQSGPNEGDAEGGKGDPAEAQGAQQPDPAAQGEGQTPAQTGGSPANPAEAGPAPADASPQSAGAADGQPLASGPDDPTGAPDSGGMGATETPVAATGDAQGAPSLSTSPPQDTKALDGPQPDAQPTGLVATDGPLLPDATQIKVSVSGADTPVLDEGEVLDIGSPQALFAEPGLAPDTVETRLDADAVLPPDLPSGPLARQRLPAWISDLMNE